MWAEDQEDVRVSKEDWRAGVRELQGLGHRTPWREDPLASTWALGTCGFSTMRHRSSGTLSPPRSDTGACAST